MKLPLAWFTVIIYDELRTLGKQSRVMGGGVDYFSSSGYPSRQHRSYLPGPSRGYHVVVGSRVYLAWYR